MFRKLRRYARAPYYQFGLYMMKHHPHAMSDRWFIKTQYRQLLGTPLNLRHPAKFCEKLQWLKLYYRNPSYVQLVDKVAVKDWVAARIGAEHVVPTLAVYNHASEIDADTLPDRFVLKCNHDSGSAILCHDKSTFDWPAARRKLEQCLCRNHYEYGREWVYRDIPPKILAEEYIEEPRNPNVLHDYKFYCFDGQAKILELVSRGRKGVGTTSAWFDMTGARLPIVGLYEKSEYNQLENISTGEFVEMRHIAEILSAGMPHVRVDLYCIDGVVLFGEMTFFNASGYEPLPEKFERMLGDMLILPATKRRYNKAKLS